MKKLLFTFMVVTVQGCTANISGSLQQPMLIGIFRIFSWSRGVGDGTASISYIPDTSNLPKGKLYTITSSAIAAGDIIKVSALAQENPGVGADSTDLKYVIVKGLSPQKYQVQDAFSGKSLGTLDYSQNDGVFNN